MRQISRRCCVFLFVIAVVLIPASPTFAFNKEAALERCRESVGKPLVRACMLSMGGRSEENRDGLFGAAGKGGGENFGETPGGEQPPRQMIMEVQRHACNDRCARFQKQLWQNYAEDGEGLRPQTQPTHDY